MIHLIITTTLKRMTQRLVNGFRRFNAGLNVVALWRQGEGQGPSEKEQIAELQQKRSACDLHLS